ncbi:hypothetical protein ABBQ38_009879 [Trebouxia sp. C0009 RCD-2024]
MPVERKHSVSRNVLGFQVYVIYERQRSRSKKASSDSYMLCHWECTHANRLMFAPWQYSSKSTSQGNQKKSQLTCNLHLSSVLHLQALSGVCHRQVLAHLMRAEVGGICRMLVCCSHVCCLLQVTAGKDGYQASSAGPRWHQRMFSQPPSRPLQGSCGQLI